jgi:pimeloyl-ACP methyl ester carboxylesterase
MSLAQNRIRVLLRSILWKSLPVSAALVLGWSLGFRACEARAADQAPPAKSDKSDDDVPPSEDADLSTDDVELKATFFPGTKGQESIPVIIIHGLEATNNRKEFDQDGGLASYLQANLGCAVIVPDLRGHGESFKTSDKKLSHYPDKKRQELLHTQYGAMNVQDLRAVKSYLWKKNNDKTLNLDKLTVIGVDGGAALAVSYADDDSKGYDNGAPYYDARKTIKLGRFVKALVLISPEFGKVNSARQALSNPVITKDLSIMILSGNQSKDFAEAKTLRNRLFNFRPKPEGDAKPEDSTLWFYSKIETKLQGPKLLGEPSLAIPEKIKGFMTARLIKNPEAKDWVWKARSLPHQ